MDRQDGAASSRSGQAYRPPVSREIAAEAAVWVTKLHGPNRTPRMESAFRSWLAISPVHRYAYECTKQAWDAVPAMTVNEAFAAAHRSAAIDKLVSQRRSRLARAWPALAIVAVVVAVVAVWQPWADGAYSTGVGQLQTVLLEDGTRLSLNTATRLRVKLSEKQRLVEIASGEALFDVAKNAQRPFVVRAGGREVVALGTVFAVRLTDAQTLSVALVEGQVAVRKAAGAGESAAGEILMRPGERVRLPLANASVSSAQAVDRPPMQTLTAWTRNMVVFDNVSLAEAVEEMNRYSRVPIVLAGGLQSSALRVDGQFRMGDNLAFAQAVAVLHELVVREKGSTVELWPK